MESLPTAQIKKFQAIVLDYYTVNAREMPWREPETSGVYDPYKIMVSEFMLQQTQVQRVIPKYQEFMASFPSIKSLAVANLSAVLLVWSGLGYNRRAKFLWQSAQDITERFSNHIPSTVEDLKSLPGVGHNTAAAIMAYAYDMPVIFIETNIRTVFIHHFFAGKTNVDDKEILLLVEKTLPDSSTRLWYYALMDYGAHLKLTVGNLNRHAKSYAKQSTFNGSSRQLRGRVLRALASQPKTFLQLQLQLQDKRLESICSGLVAEGLIGKKGSFYTLG